MLSYGGSAVTKSGASSSFGPPLGLPFLAHCEKNKIRKANKRKCIFLKR